jgi:hypothetical protein
MSNEEIIQSAYFALARSMSPSLTKEQQKKELASCWEVLSEGFDRVCQTTEVVN